MNVNIKRKNEGGHEMKNVLMLYASMTGNTELMADEMIKQLQENSVQPVVKTFADDDIEVGELSNYDVIFIGVYTWADGELPLEAEDFFDELHTMDLTQKVCGVFGSADTSYEAYGTAVEIMHEELEEAGAKLVSDGIIVDREPEEDEL